MSESTDLTVIEIKPEQAPVLYVTNGLDDYLAHIKASVNEAPDLSTKKGRDRVASLAAQVSRSKTAIEKPGREYLKRLKEAVKPAEQEIKRFVDACDALRDETRRPLTEWEAEQERIKAEEEAKRKAAELAKQVEADHEIALLLNEKVDREIAEAKAEAERKRVAHEEELKRQAAEQARIEAEQKAKAEIEAAARREAEAKEAKARIELEAKQAAEQAERQRIEALQRAETEKQQAIEAEQRRAKEEADRIRLEAEQKESARLAEEKRISDEAKKRADDIQHRKVIGTGIVTALLAHTSLNREQAIEVLTALKDGLIPNSSITY